jgi:DNA-binding transcriptional MerR regulator
MTRRAGSERRAERPDRVEPADAARAGGAPRPGAKPPTESAARARRARRPTYYAIGDVCRLLDIKPHVLRYWETQFEDLAPTKNRAGNRVYEAAHLELIALIRQLVHEERYTIEGARQRLAELRAGAAGGQRAGRPLERAFLRSLRGELEAVMDLLDPGSR